MWHSFPTAPISRTVLVVLGPLAMMIVLLWAIPFVGGLFDGAGSTDTASTRGVVLSSLLDETSRRDMLPVLPQLRAFGGPDDFPDQPRFGVVVGDRLLAVGSTTMTPFDLESGAIGPALDLGGVIGAVGAVQSVTRTPQSELWIGGREGLTRIDAAAPDRPTRVVKLDREAFGPLWFGNRVAAAGRTTPLRVYEVDANDTASLIGTTAPLFPIVDPGLLPFFNLASFTVHPDQRQIAVAFQLSSRLHLHDHTGALTRAVAGPVEVKLDFDIVPRAPDVGGHTFGMNSETRMAYIDVESDRRLIAALFAGRSRSTGARNLFAGDELHVFRWDGTPVGAWRLPEAVASFQLDETRRRIYAVRQGPAPAILEIDAGPLYRDEAGEQP